MVSLRILLPFAIQTVVFARAPSAMHVHPILVLGSSIGIGVSASTPFALTVAAIQWRVLYIIVDAVRADLVVAVRARLVLSG